MKIKIFNSGGDLRISGGAGPGEVKKMPVGLLITIRQLLYVVKYRSGSGDVTVFLHGETVGKRLAAYMCCSGGADCCFAD